MASPFSYTYGTSLLLFVTEQLHCIVSVSKSLMMGAIFYSSLNFQFLKYDVNFVGGRKEANEKAEKKRGYQGN